MDDLIKGLKEQRVSVCVYTLQLVRRTAKSKITFSISSDALPTLFI
jgi:hypothetical protein